MYNHENPPKIHSSPFDTQGLYETKRNNKQIYKNRLFALSFIHKIPP
jgi:hypothetical protein